MQGESRILGTSTTIYRLLAIITTLSFFFDVMKVLDRLLLIFVEDSFILIKKILVYFK